MEELEVFTSEEFGQIRTVIINDEPYFVGKDVASILGYKNSRVALQDNVDNEDRVVTKVTTSGGTQNTTVISESGLYSLVFGSKLPIAKKFKYWVTSEVLPTIRKTGGYVSNDNLFVDTYLPFADEQTRLLFSTTLHTIRKQNEVISTQKRELLHKQEIINGLTDNIDIYTKRNVINRICKRASSNYANRYKELYRCFRETFHIDLEARCEGYNLKQAKRKDQLSVIKYAEQFGHIDSLFDCCTKLYETEVQIILDELRLVQN